MPLRVKLVGPLGKNPLVVEEMQFLSVGQRDLRMLAQEIVKCGRARLLRARHNEIQPLHS